MNTPLPSGALYMIATPIGNLGDMTPRAVEALKEIEVLYAEDTRVTRQLLRHFGIDRAVFTYNQHSSDRIKAEILIHLATGKRVGYVSDAGTPGISDPGNELISFITSNTSVDVFSIPGVSSLSVALSICGFPIVPFMFLGFLPKSKRQKLFKNLLTVDMPVVFFDSPFRIIKTLEQLKVSFGDDREIFVGRELTKLYETHYRGTIKSVHETLSQQPVKGEIVCVLNLKSPKKTEQYHRVQN